MQTDILYTHDPEWEAFVRSREDAELCHLPEWGAMLSRTLGHRTFCLTARHADGLCGVLPLTLVRSRIFGTRLISQAFSNYGGPALRDPAALAPLLDQARQLARQYRCRYVELRSTAPLSPEFQVDREKVCMHLPLAPDAEEVWRRLRPEIRNRVRKAEKAGLTVLQGGEELVPDFYRVWTLRMQQLGTPCYPRRLFSNLLRSFPDQARVFVVQHNRRTVAAGFFYHFHGLAQCRWAATDVAFNELAPNMLLYWSAIKYHCQAGLRWFDFGRSTMDSSQYEFKRRWGARTVQLYYQYWSPSSLSVAVIKPDQPQYRRKVTVWRKLPLCLTRLIGPYLSRGLA
jgi:FemAB-related protein (PEP-CTERM system-associated)